MCVCVCVCVIVCVSVCVLSSRMCVGVSFYNQHKTQTLEKMRWVCSVDKTASFCSLVRKSAKSLRWFTYFVSDLHSEHRTCLRFAGSTFVCVFFLECRGDIFVWATLIRMTTELLWRSGVEWNFKNFTKWWQNKLLGSALHRTVLHYNLTRTACFRAITWTASHIIEPGVKRAPYHWAGRTALPSLGVPLYYHPGGEVCNVFRLKKKWGINSSSALPRALPLGQWVGF